MNERVAVGVPKLRVLHLASAIERVVLRTIAQHSPLKRNPPAKSFDEAMSEKKAKSAAASGPVGTWRLKCQQTVNGFRTALSTCKTGWSTANSGSVAAVGSLINSYVEIQ